MEYCLKISVIIPIYNSEKSLEKLFFSIDKNYREDIEYILINDGSKDNSYKLCEEFKNTHKNVLYRYQENKGVSAARNNGIEISSGQYVMFIDSDDSIESGFFDYFLTVNDRIDFAITGYSIVENENTIQSFLCQDFIGTTEKFLEKIGYYTNPPYLYSPWAKIFKKSIIDKNGLRFDENITYGEDVIFVLEFLKNTEYIQSIKGSKYLYSVANCNSLARAFNKSKFDFDMLGTKSLKKLLELYNNSNIETICENKIKQNFVLYCHGMLNTHMNLHEIKTLFFDNVGKYNLSQYNWFNKKCSFIVIGIIIKISFLFPLILLLKF